MSRAGKEITVLQQELDLRERLRRIQNEKEMFQEDVKLAEGSLFDLAFEERDIQRKLEELKPNPRQSGGGKG